MSREWFGLELRLENQLNQPSIRDLGFGSLVGECSDPVVDSFQRVIFKNGVSKSWMKLF